MLLKVELPVEGSSEATQLYLDQCRSFSGVLAPPVPPVSFIEYRDRVQCLRECTTSSPSAVSPVMVKTEACDPLLRQISWHAFNYFW
eukprot:15216965-Ditylum_brightwellii.AAC.1